MLLPVTFTVLFTKPGKYSDAVPFTSFSVKVCPAPLLNGPTSNVTAPAAFGNARLFTWKGVDES